LFRSLLASLTLAPLAACSQGSETAEEMGQVDQSLAAALGDTDGMSTVAEMIADAGLAPVFDGSGAYTILAPQDAVFDQLGSAADDLKKPENRAAMVAILRGHILPGYLTMSAVNDAIEQGGGSMEMRAMDGTIVTFRKDGNSFVITGIDDATAKVAGQAIEASNGVAIPIDGLLKGPPAESDPANQN
jgi:uncharacterized surface protein with fasciclin (FAS1) repeats